MNKGQRTIVGLLTVIAVVQVLSLLGVSPSRVEAQPSYAGEPGPTIVDYEVAGTRAWRSDGLVGMLEDEDIERILQERLGGAPDPEVLELALEALVAAANEAGGHDNITVVLVLVGFGTPH